MPQEPAWPESHNEQTDVLPVVSPGSPGPYGQSTSSAPVGDEPPEGGRTWRKAGIITGSIFGFLLLLYGVDLMVSQGDVPRGVSVAGVDVGGMDRTAAEQKLREDLGPRLKQPVKILAGDVRETVDPAAAGLSLDWESTVEQAGDQPLNPITRITSFFGSSEAGVVSNADYTKLNSAMDGVRQKVDRDPVEGSIKFEGTQPVPVLPRAGQKLDAHTAEQNLLKNWASGKQVELPVANTPVNISLGAIRDAIEQIAKPAVLGKLVLHGDGKDALLDPKTIASALAFEPGEGGRLNPRIDQAKVIQAAAPQLKPTEKEGKDAQIVFAGGRPTVNPSEDGKTVDWNASLAPMLDVLKRPDGRDLKAQYAMKPAKVTTDQANQLGVKEVIGEFTTSDFAPDSGANIHTVADKVNGAIVKPGDTFSLNEFTGPRGPAQGYVDAGVIENGAPAREVGGGISQFATTMYNASYFAAMKDAGHKEHSYYISRYPAAREATVFQSPDGASVIDLKFTNDAPTGVAIQTIWTPKSITVKLWGTKKYNVESVPGPRTDPVPQPTKPGPPDPTCHPSEGAPGFNTSDTRILRDAATGAEVRRSTRNVHYNPQPKTTCGPPPPP